MPAEVNIPEALRLLREALRLLPSDAQGSPPAQRIDELKMNAAEMQYFRRLLVEALTHMPGDIRKASLMGVVIQVQAVHQAWGGPPKTAGERSSLACLLVLLLSMPLLCPPALGCPSPPDLACIHPPDYC